MQSDRNLLAPCARRIRWPAGSRCLWRIGLVPLAVGKMDARRSLGLSIPKARLGARAMRIAAGSSALGAFLLRSFAWGGSDASMALRPWTGLCCARRLAAPSSIEPLCKRLARSGDDPLRGARAIASVSAGRMAQAARSSAATLWNRAGARWGRLEPVIPSPPAPSPSLPGVPHRFSAARIASAGSCAKAKSGWPSVGRQRLRQPDFAKLRINLPPVLLAAKKSARPLGPCEDGSGCDGIRGRPAPVPC